MHSVLFALIPVFLVIVLGYLLRRRAFLADEVWSGLENLCYYLLFPALLIKTLATAQLGSAEVLRFSATLLFAILTMSGLLLLSFPLLKRYFKVSAAAFTSIVQGAIRWHTFVALSIVGLLYGDEGVGYMAVTMAVIIPLLNVISVSVLARFGEGAGDLRTVLGKLARNPLIISCVIGAVLNLSGLGLPQPFYSLLHILGGGALGLGLLTVGAGLRISLVREHRGQVIFGSLLRLLGMPMLMLAGAWLFGVDGLARTVAVIAAAVPTASSSYILARQMGGDAPLMANLITMQVLVAAVTLPFMVWLSGV